LIETENSAGKKRAPLKNRALNRYAGIMEKPNPTVNDLFKQLGLPHSDEEVRLFIATHGPIAETVKLYEAPCWTPAQAALLQEIIEDDASWSYLADELDALLRMEPET
jgi:hypothetical protein